MRRNYRDMIALAISEGAENVSIEMGRKHPKLIATVDGKQIRYVFPGSTAHRRVCDAARTFIRRARREAVEAQ